MVGLGASNLDLNVRVDDLALGLAEGLGQLRRRDDLDRELLGREGGLLVDGRVVLGRRRGLDEVAAVSVVLKLAQVELEGSVVRLVVEGDDVAAVLPVLGRVVVGRVDTRALGVDARHGLGVELLCEKVFFFSIDMKENKSCGSFTVFLGVLVAKFGRLGLDKGEDFVGLALDLVKALEVARLGAVDQVRQVLVHLDLATLGVSVGGLELLGLGGRGVVVLFLLVVALLVRLVLVVLDFRRDSWVGAGG